MIVEWDGKEKSQKRQYKKIRASENRYRGYVFPTQDLCGTQGSKVMTSLDKVIYLTHIKPRHFLPYSSLYLFSFFINTISFSIISLFSSSLFLNCLLILFHIVFFFACAVLN